MSSLAKILLTLGLSPDLASFLSCSLTSSFISLPVISSSSDSLPSSSSSSPSTAILLKRSNSFQLILSSPSSSSLSVSLLSSLLLNSKPILVSALLNSLRLSVPFPFLSNVLKTLFNLGLPLSVLASLLISFLTMAAKSPSLLFLLADRRPGVFSPFLLPLDSSSELSPSSSSSSSSELSLAISSTIGPTSSIVWFASSSTSLSWNSSASASKSMS
mmetsp:Transcript_14748/g.27277  ORF Transcript_14748/g.27277 Transcript_14748/m.27277 type:complete len:216 (-) Transcript_14748:109-756(-)